MLDHKFDSFRADCDARYATRDRVDKFEAETKHTLKNLQEKVTRIEYYGSEAGTSASSAANWKSDRIVAQGWCPTMEDTPIMGITSEEAVPLAQAVSKLPRTSQRCYMRPSGKVTKAESGGWNGRSRTWTVSRKSVQGCKPSCQRSRPRVKAWKQK